MSPRITLGLLAVLLALGGYVYFGGGSGTQANQAASKEKPTDAELEVFKFEDRNVRQLAVQKGDQQIAVDRDAEGNWKLQPTGEPGDRIRLNGLALRLSNLRASRRLADAANLQDFGLATPATTARIILADGTEHTLLVGAKAPAEAGTYAKRANDETVFLVSNALVQDLERLITEPPREPPTPSPAPSPTSSP
jgi:Domain of unknown function (DUF4340)